MGSFATCAPKGQAKELKSLVSSMTWRERALARQIRYGDGQLRYMIPVTKRDHIHDEILNIISQGQEILVGLSCVMPASILRFIFSNLLEQDGVKRLGRSTKRLSSAANMNACLPVE